MSKKLSLDDIEWQLTVEPEEVSVRGNALASGDDAVDKECEDKIIERLNNGDVWAWAAVTVTGRWNGIKASDHLGCCSYADADDFQQPGGYYDDMRATVLADIQDQAEAIAEAMS